MLAVFFGNDKIKVREEALLYANKNKTAEQTVEKVEVENCLNGQLLGLAESETLFGEVPVYILDGVLGDSEVAESFFSNLEILSSSKVRFVLIADKILAAEKKKIEKHTKEIFEFKKTEKEIFNIFNLTDAWLNRDKKKLWLLLQEAKMNGTSSEAIVGILWWQLKTLRLAQLTNSASVAGMKDFSYNKSKRALGKFKAGEIEKKSLELLKIYHDGHKGVVDFSLVLEEWCLS